VQLPHASRMVPEGCVGEYARQDPDLAAVNAAWPHLPAAIGAGIVATVNAAFVR
jgi:hypothetical protein